MVRWNRITDEEVTVSSTCKNQIPSQISSSDSEESIVTKKKPCYRPKRKPSNARVRAQKIITEHNNNRQKKGVPLTPQAQVMSTPILPEPEPIAPDMADIQDSSDDTILCTPPQSPERKKGKRQVAKFVIRTVGLKMHHNTETVKEGNKIRSRNFRCYLCRERMSSTRKLNTHFKIDHEGLDCLECGKEFNRPLSLKKHSYIHKLCNFKCSRCEKQFPFKSQRDFHEKVHDNLWFLCPKQSCDSAFSRESDLRQHLERHDSSPIKCKHCEYKKH